MLHIPKVSFSQDFSSTQPTYEYGEGRPAIFTQFFQKSFQLKVLNRQKIERCDHTHCFDLKGDPVAINSILNSQSELVCLNIYMLIIFFS